jgi:hypothetical protein
LCKQQIKSLLSHFIMKTRHFTVKLLMSFFL